MFVLFYLLFSSDIVFCASGKVIQSPKFNLVTSPLDVESDEVMETQYTNCKITSNQLIADAQATVTRVLTGGFTSKIIEERFQNLEKILISQLEDIKKLIQRILDSKDKIILPEKKSDEFSLKSPRQYEIDKYNGTVHEVMENNASRKLFNYYWRVDEVRRKIFEWSPRRSERSSTFYIKDIGYAMFLKFTPKYFPDGTVFISIGLTKGDQDSILTWPFSHRLRIEVLEHSSRKFRTDRRSMIWDPSTVCSQYFWGRPRIIKNNPDNSECVGLSIPEYLLLSNRNFLWNDNLFIKLTVYI